MIKIDHLTRDDYVCNPLLNHLVIDYGDAPDVNNVALETQTSRIPPIVSHMRWSMSAVANFRGVCFRLIRL